jgi:hypothetical protein
MPGGDAAKPLGAKQMSYPGIDETVNNSPKPTERAACGNSWQDWPFSSRCLSPRSNPKPAKTANADSVSVAARRSDWVGSSKGKTYYRAGWCSPHCNGRDDGR